MSRLVGNAPLTASVLRRHLQRDPYKATSVILRALPAPVRRPLLGAVVQDRAPALSALALDASGDRGAAVEVLRAHLADGRARQLRGAAAVAATLDQAQLADEALSRLPAEDPGRARLQALAASSRGDLQQALSHAATVPGRRGRRLRSHLEGQLAALRAEGIVPLLTRHAPAKTGRVPSHIAHPSAQTCHGAARRESDRRTERVLHVVSNALPDVQAGYTLRTHGIVTAQHDAGVEPHVVTRLGFPVDSGVVAAPRQVRLDGVPYHRLLPRRPLPSSAADHLALNVAEVVGLAERIRPTVLHAHSKHDNAQVALLAGRELQLPVVYEVRGLLEETWRSRGGDRSSDFYQLSRQAETRCMQAAAAVVTIGGALREEIVSRGVPGAKVHVVPNAVSEDFLGPLPDTAQLRAQLGIPPDATVFGVVSTLNDYEGIDTLIEALRLMDEPSAVLLVVGDGPARARLSSLAAPLGGQVVMTGRVPHQRVRDYHAAIDVFCVPRRSTPVTVLVPPLKPMEAMACGRPVLASDLPPLREIVSSGSFGDLAAPDEPLDWAGRMRALLYAEQRRHRMGANARSWVAEHGTWSAAAERYEGIYADARSRWEAAQH